MTTARYRPTWELAVDPLISCKLCLGEFPLEQMTTITQCQCVFCTLVSHAAGSAESSRAKSPVFVWETRKCSEKIYLFIFKGETQSTSCLHQQQA